MPLTTRNVDHPSKLNITPAGDMTGATRHYEKTLGEMADVYRDNASWQAQIDQHGADRLVYYVNEQRYQEGPGSLIVGTSVLLPGSYGEEFAVTRGHLHATADRAELYHCLSGHGVMLLETVDGETEAVELVAGQAVNVPGHWIHRSVNVGDEPFVSLFCYNADAGQDYNIISDAGGMKSLVVRDRSGWTTTANPSHHGYAAEQSA